MAQTNPSDDGDAIRSDRLPHESMAWIRLGRFYSQIEGQLERALSRDCSIGVSEFLALNACSAAPDGEMRMNELSEAVNLNQSSASRLVARLERSGLTERRMCEHDRRGVYTGITDHGREVLEKAVPVYTKALWQALSRISGDERFADFVHLIRSASGNTGQDLLSRAG